MSERTTENAVAWLQNSNSGSVLFNSNEAQGYYATSLDALDPTGNKAGSSSTRALVDWSGDDCAYAGSQLYSACLTPSGATTVDGYTSRYIITRMCRIEGDVNAAGNNCARALATAGNDSPKRGEFKYGDDKRFTSPSGPYYRILTRTDGPKDTVSYTETYVYF